MHAVFSQGLPGRPMDVLLTGFGVFLVAVGVALLALTLLRPEEARRERRRRRRLHHLARDAGLAGRWRLRDDRASSTPPSEHGTYEPASDEDKALFETVGPRIEGEAKFFATEMLWTDARLLWAGAGVLLLGVANTLDSNLM